MKKLSNVLVLCAPNGAPTPACHETILALHKAGAVIQIGQCTSDAALTRNKQAALAYRHLMSSGGVVFDWVFWLDGDMSAPPDAVRLMISVARALTDGGVVPSISGMYVNRHHPAGHLEVAAFALNGAVERVVAVEQLEPTAPGGKSTLLHLRCVPALTGLGCFLQSAATFLAHYDESPRFVHTDINNPIAAVCQAHLIHASELGQWVDVDRNADRAFWIAEDFDYCTRELEEGRMVYVAPISWAHDKVISLMPDSRTVFPGLLPPSPELDSTG